jgi:thymidylate synthase
MNRLDKQYTELLQDILDNGIEKTDRTGTGTISVFGRQIRHKMSEGFPLLTSKRIKFELIVTELLWFLRGDTNIKYLVDNNCHIWDGDTFKYFRSTFSQMPGIQASLPNQEEFINKIKTDNEYAKKWGELGKIYGKQWRRWNNYKGDEIAPNGFEMWNEPIDQIANLINDLKTNPDSRRLMVNAWNVGELDQMVLPPCHYGFQVYTRELSHKERIELAWPVFFPDRKNESVPDWWNVKGLSMDEKNIPTRAISLMWNQRSVDTFLGLPFNIASYGLLLEIIAKIVNMVPDELIGNLGDTHLYSNHIEQAREQIGRRYTTEERHDMLKKSMGDFYQTAVDEQIAFGGGLSKYYISYNIPLQTREPYVLPKLIHGKTSDFYRSLGEELSLITHLEPIDFTLDNYKSHPAIKAPLSN